MSDRALRLWAKVCLALLTAFIVSMCFSSCRPVRTVTSKSTEVKSDSLEVYRLQRANDSLTVERKHLKLLNKTLTQQVYSRQQGTGEKDSTLPVKSLTIWNGNAYVKLEYQGLINTYDFFIPPSETVVVKEYISDSTSSDASTAVIDSNATVKSSSEAVNNNSLITEGPSKLQQVLIFLRNFWWFLIVVVVVWEIFRRQIKKYLPFLS